MTRYWMVIGCVLIGYAFPVKCEEDLVHFGAHVGMSYAINTFCYGLFHKGIGMDRFDSLLMAGFTTLLVGITYKFMEASEDGQLPKNTGVAMGRNALGVGLSITTVIMFSF